MFNFNQKINGQLFGLICFAVMLLSTLSPHLELLADEWNETYDKGKLALQRGEWEQAVRHFQTALSLRDTPNAQATTSNLKLVEYLPYYHLGQAYFYLGDYDLALENFEKARHAGAVNQTAYKNYLARLSEMSRQMQRASQQQGEKDELEAQMAAVTNSIEREEFGRARTVLRQLKNKHPENKTIAALEQALKKIEDRADFQPSQAKAGSESEERFRKGLDYFLVGQYELALQQFRAAERLDPDFTTAQDWIRKTISEMERLRLESNQQDEPKVEVTEKIIQQTSAPVFAVSSPKGQVTEVRSSEFNLTGTVADDKGIDYVEITLNGQPLQNRAGERVILQPKDSTEAKNFSFSAAIPLRRGENQIVLTAFDVDSTIHRTIEPRRVIRKPPIYQTTTFGVSLGSIVLLGVGVFFAARVVKYRIAIVNKYNPYIAGSPIRNEEMFFGREKLIKRILNTLHNNSLMVYGPRRIGKTTLQHQLKRCLEQLQDPEFEFIPVMIDLQGTSEKRFFQTLMEEIIEVCKPKLDGRTSFRFNDKKTDYSGRDFSRDLKKLLEILGRQTEKKLKLVLLMDEVDEMNKYSEQVNQRLRSVFMKTFAESLVAVMSGAYLKKTWESEGSPWYNFFEEIEVPPFEREDAENLIRKPVAGIFSYDDEAIDKIIEYSECKPYIIQKFCVNVINRIIEQKRRRVTLEDVEAVKPQVLSSTEVRFSA
ncbi:tetratricopeptide repeat protein [candidate division KSB1 bacterium]|nr:tetratricopeptide repeat protein [candidate division KSB1 bacterium]NIT74539.1 tetratricopeptide repeat protein [candidate division KSB1 bacterium]NIX74219.1 tetratricopeptide repeat protein [candidate division KSB1 bacterium]